MKVLTLVTFATGGFAMTAAKHDMARSVEIERVNRIPGVKWTAGFNSRFRGLPSNATKPLLGVNVEENKAVMEQAIAQGKLHVQDYSGVAIPDEFDSATEWPECAKTITDIRDQSNCGCCWAFGAAEAASDRLCIATGGSVVIPLSAQDICFCASTDGCNGGDLFTPWSYIQTSGVVTGGQYNGTGPFGEGMCKSFSMPHCHHHGPQGDDPYPPEGAPGCPSQTSAHCESSCDSTAIAPHNDYKTDKYTFSSVVTTYSSVEAIQEAIMGQGPVEAAFLVYSDFANYVSGVYHRTSSEVEGGHAIRIVGWGTDNGTDYWKIANSWNPYWGEKGYFRIVRGTNECNIEQGVTANMADAKWSKKNP
mmetsp:Transcript_18281/g.25687  ORF Transcript_18281/g.25687 Transcript_18281/m.25687 type:complete len:363 (-) Transcript_18281:307-1395(-)|eukprot:CAMPEP_0175092502 /NCGR_PEP_ID=MMETSP0086_2-20121207/2497_1 /TAXON_ID=136419 /ORGANISM="Unknown Unknown, Strain D1" /LENGTH=362 /DNA_ID=CAMNT_0016365369 /DNA_START=17 /DNA_END=1105 /DNA_ORIENTATION=+